MQRWLLIIVTVLAIIIGLTIGLLNADEVSLDIFFKQLNTSLGVVVTGSFVCGLLLGSLGLWLFGMLPLSLKHKRLKRQLTQQVNDSANSNSNALSTEVAR